MSSIIEVKNLSKTFVNDKIETPVLRNINLNIEKGSFVSIMGPSGSGKSTLLYLIGGLDEPTKGKVLIKGKDIVALKDKDISIMRRQDIGFVFQFYNLIPNLTVEDNIMLPILLDGKKVKDYKDKLDEVLESVGLQERRKHLPKQLSGGQQQRTAIARSLINDPEIILADEPIGNLDTKTGFEIMELLKKINVSKGKTIIQVTHSIEASEYGDTLVKIRDGEIERN